MLEENEIEGRIQKNKNVLQMLQIQNESIDRDVEGMFKELNVSAEQLSSFLSEESHFTSENWEFLKKEEKQQHEKMLAALSNISHPKNAARKRAQQSQVQQHWLFVR